jgi:hypothetical protein
LKLQLHMLGSYNSKLFLLKLVHGFSSGFHNYGKMDGEINLYRGLSKMSDRV